MAGIEIPRAERQVGDPSEVFRGRAVAPTAATEATQQLGRAIAGAGVNIARISAANERMAREELLNRSVSAANEIKQNSVNFIADETVTKAGLDTIGNVERLDSFVEEKFMESTADMSDEAKILTRQELQNWQLKTRTDFAIRQREQRRGVTLSNLDQARDEAIQEAAANPSVNTIEDQIKAMAITVFKYRATGSIDKEDAEERIEDGREKIITSAITSASLQNPEAAQVILDEMRTVLPAETVKSLEADIKKQIKIQEKEDEAARTKSVQDLTNKIIGQSLDGTATVAQMKADPRWEAATSAEKKDMISIVKKSDPFNESDPVVLANFTTQVNTDPTKLIKQDFIDAHGEGLSTADFNRLYKQWQGTEGKTETPQESAIKQAYRILSDAKTKTVYSNDPVENSVRWSRATQALDVFVEENPNAEPEEYTDFVQTILDPDQRNFIVRAFDFNLRFVTGARFGEPAVVTNQELRTESIKILTQQGESLTEANISFIAQQLEDNRNAKR